MIRTFYPMCILLKSNQYLKAQVVDTQHKTREQRLIKHNRDAANINLLNLCIFRGLGIITARKRSCGKVMFLHLRVILFTGGVSVREIHPPGQRLPPYGNERAVRILLECISVTLQFQP